MWNTALLNAPTEHWTTMNAICATTVDPVASMKVLEMFNTNKEIYRLLSFGIEGVHYEYLDKELDVIQLPEGKTDAEIAAALAAARDEVAALKLQYDAASTNEEALAVAHQIAQVKRDAA